MSPKKRQATYRFKRRTLGPEELLQAAIVDYLNLVKPRLFWFHVPNGIRTSPNQARKFKRLGMRAGVADFVFLLAKGKTGLMELKSAVGTTSEAQEAFRRACVDLGHDYRLVRNLSQFERVLIEWGAIDGPRLVTEMPEKRTLVPRRGEKSPRRV